MDSTDLPPQTRLFLSAYGRFARISLDIFRVDKRYKDIELEDKSEQHRNLLDPERFEQTYYRHIFVDRPATHRILLSKLNRPGQHNTICFIGPARSGKTSILRKLWQQLQDTPNAFCLYIDTRRVLRENPDVLFMEALSKDVFSCYKSILFDRESHLPNSNKKALYALYAFALSHAGGGGIYRDLYDYRERTLSLIDGTSPSEFTPTFETFYQWIIDYGLRNPQSRELLRELSSATRLRHLALAARHLYKKDPQIILLDNVDQLRRSQQVQLFSEAHDLHGQVDDMVKFCIAIRDENIRDCADARFPEKGVPPNTTRIRIDMPQYKGLVDFPHCELAAATPGELIRIVNRRLSTTKVFLEEERLQLKEQQSADPAEGKAHLASKDEDVHAAAVSRTHINHIRRLSNKMLGALNEDSLICLTNGSIQDFLALHLDLLTRLLKIRPPGHPPDDEPLQPWMIKTLCYQYFREAERDYNFGIPNLFEECRKWKGQKDWVGCSLKYLIGATTWGLEIPTERLSARYPTLKKVVTKLGELGFTTETLEDEIQANLKNNILSYRDPKLNRNEFHPDHQVLVSLRGKTLISYTLPSFGYLYQCYREVAGEGNIPIVRGANLNRLLAFMIDDIVALGDMHLRTMWRLYTINSLYEISGFVTYYRQNFGRPDSFHPYRAPQKTQKTNKLLLFETILIRLLAYLSRESPESSRPARACLQEILRVFLKCLKQINSGEHPLGGSPSDKLLFTRELASTVEKFKHAAFEPLG